MSVKTELAEKAGRAAYHKGILASAQDPIMCNGGILKGVKVGDALPILKAWNMGWTHEHLKAPIPEMV